MRTKEPTPKRVHTILFFDYQRQTDGGWRSFSERCHTAICTGSNTRGDGRFEGRYTNLFSQSTNKTVSFLFGFYFIQRGPLLVVLTWVPILSYSYFVGSSRDMSSVWDSTPWNAPWERHRTWPTHGREPGLDGGGGKPEEWTTIARANGFWKAFSRRTRCPGFTSYRVNDLITTENDQLDASHHIALEMAFALLPVVPTLKFVVVASFLLFLTPWGLFCSLPFEVNRY